MTRAQFAAEFGALAAACRAKVEPEALESYYRGLDDLPLNAVSESSKSLAKEPGRRFMPTLGEWRETALQLRAAATAVALSGRSDPWHHECAFCEDTGMHQFTADGKVLSCPEQPCGRDQIHGPHTWCRPCVCRSSNRTYQRKHLQAKGKSAA